MEGNFPLIRKLQMLIEEGLANNVDMQAAILRVKEAKALLTSARLSYLPFLWPLAPLGSLTSVDKSTPVKNYTLPASASWEVDLFGKLLNAIVARKHLICKVRPISRQCVHS